MLRRTFLKVVGAVAAAVVVPWRAVTHWRNPAGLHMAHGAIWWPASDRVGTTYRVSGLPFSPKALRMSWQHDGHAGVGFATGPDGQRCVATNVDQARHDCVVIHGDRTLTVTKLTRGGLVLTSNGRTAADMHLLWEAWGGDAITAASVGDVDGPRT